MQLYFREKQLALLEQIFDSVGKGSNFVLLFGKRKVGKTTLIAEHLNRNNGVYLTISSKATQLQLADISDYLRAVNFTDGFIPSFRTWREFFEYMFYVSKEKPVNLAIDEFHNFERTEPEVFDEIKRLWDKFSSTSSLNLIAISSDQDFIHRVFYSRESSLYEINRNTIKLTPFVFAEVAKIMQMNESILPMQELIKIYTVFGGLPKYYALIDQFQLWNKSFGEILQELVFKKFAPLGFELKEMIINEFTRNNSVYLSILQAIASGKSTVTEIAKAVAIPATSVVKYLTELEKKKGLVKRLNPVGTVDPSRSKYGRYALNNYFENFWFRFIQPDIISYEMGYYEKMMANVAQQLPAYVQQRIKLIIKEILLDNVTHPTLASKIGFTAEEIGEAWNREVAFDLAVRGSDPKQILLGSIFNNPFQMSSQGISDYKKNVESMMKMYPEYEPEYLIVTWENPTNEFKEFLNNGNIKHLLLHDILSLTGYSAKTEKTMRYTMSQGLQPAASKSRVEKTNKAIKKQN